jgi:uncharacterized protein YkwD
MRLVKTECNSWGVFVDRLEDRRLLAFNPSGMEQEALELINRMRVNPAAELPLLLNSGDDYVESALAQFGVKKKVLRKQWGKLKAAPPLAWNEAIYKAATKHTQKIVAADVQSHQVAGELPLGERIAAEGYSLLGAGENVFSFVTTVFQTHAAFAIDWGAGKNGIQNLPGHRANIMSKSFVEAGISILKAKKGAQTGPFLTTQDFGAPQNRGNAFLMGTVRKEKDKDGAYDAGEGLAGRKVKISGSAGTFKTTTLGSGAFQAAVPAGTYQITVTGRGLGKGIRVKGVVVGTDNVKRDFVVGG